MGETTDTVTDIGQPGTIARPRVLVAYSLYVSTTLTTLATLFPVTRGDFAVCEIICSGWKQSSQSSESSTRLLLIAASPARAREVMWWCCNDLRSLRVSAGFSRREGRIIDRLVLRVAAPKSKKPVGPPKHKLARPAFGLSRLPRARGRA